MNGYIRKYGYILSAAFAFFAVACSMDEYNEVCDYSVELRYDYNRENSTAANLLDTYISSITEYIFDENEVLYALNTIKPDPCDDLLKSEHMLPPGRYSVISWGNMSEASAVNEARVGVTTRSRMEMMMKNPCAVYPGCQKNGDRLYEGYRTFTVNPVGISRVRVDMVHSHLSLRFRVRWGTGAVKPPVGQGLHLRITTLASQYNFMPQYIFVNGVCRNHDTAEYDRYNSVCSAWIPHIPLVRGNVNILTHRVNTNVDTEREASGEFVTFRLLNGSAANLSLYKTDPEGVVGEQIGEEINLGRYFLGESIELSRNLRQEFAIELLINADGSVSVMPFDIAEWDEGGSVGFN